MVSFIRIVVATLYICTSAAVNLGRRNSPATRRKSTGDVGFCADLVPSSAGARRNSMGDGKPFLLRRLSFEAHERGKCEQRNSECRCLEQLRNLQVRHELLRDLRECQNQLRELEAKQQVMQKQIDDNRAFISAVHKSNVHLQILEEQLKINLPRGRKSIRKMIQDAFTSKFFENEMTL